MNNACHPSPIDRSSCRLYSSNLQSDCTPNPDDYCLTYNFTRQSQSRRVLIEEPHQTPGSYQRHNFLDHASLNALKIAGNLLTAEYNSGEKPESIFSLNNNDTVPSNGYQKRHYRKGIINVHRASPSNMKLNQLNGNRKRRLLDESVSSSSESEPDNHCPPRKRLHFDIKREIEHPMIEFNDNRASVRQIVKKRVKAAADTVYEEFIGPENLGSDEILVMMANLTCKSSKVKRQHSVEAANDLGSSAVPTDSAPRFANRTAYKCFGILPDYDTGDKSPEKEQIYWNEDSGRKRIENWQSKTVRVDALLNDYAVYKHPVVDIMLHNCAHLAMLSSTVLGDVPSTIYQEFDVAQRDEYLRRSVDQIKLPLTKFLLYMQSTRNREINSDDVVNVPLYDLQENDTILKDYDQMRANYRNGIIHTDDAICNPFVRGSTGYDFYQNSSLVNHNLRYRAFRNPLLSFPTMSSSLGRHPLHIGYFI